MSSYIGDLSAYAASSAGGAGAARATQDRTNLDMNDFLMLMVAQFQNQSIDNTADTSDMLNQLVQMSVVQAISNITDATVMMYSASLVGKTVTVGQYNNGKLEELEGTVTGTGVLNGEQIIFLDDGSSYYLSDIMAVGRIPSKDEVTPAPDSGTEQKPDDGQEPPEEPEAVG